MPTTTNRLDAAGRRITRQQTQADTYEAFTDWCPHKEWHAESRRDTGLVRERVIAMDGTTISEREYTDD
jgi:nitrite reductase/ring-hydroxylating ferredoxin subunit